MNFHSPEWLWAGFAALALVAIFNVWASRRRKTALAKFASERLLPELSRTVSPVKLFLKKLLFALGVFFVFVALARPQWGYRWEETKTRGIDIVFAVDTSKSMLAEDVKPSRLDRAKLAVLDLVNTLGSDKIGLVAFSGQAFLQCPLTLDYDAFKMSLEALDTNIIQRGGTNIAAAIAEAEVAFADTTNKKVVILISDGEELEASGVEKAKEAAERGIVIYTLGVGGAKGQPIPVRDESGRLANLRDESGNIVKSKLNEDTLSEVAKATGGFYEPLSADGMDIIYNKGLKSIPQEELSARMRKLAIERFQIPLLVSIILLALETLIGTRKFFIGNGFGGMRIGSRMLALVCAASIFGICSNEVSAQNNSAGKETARTSPETAREISAAQDSPSVKNAVAENAEEAVAEAKKVPNARDLFNAGVDEYKAGNFRGSKDKFTEAMKLDDENFALHSKAFYNMGNADYYLAKKSLEDAAAPADIARKAEELSGAALSAINDGEKIAEQGQPLLEAEQKILAEAKTDNEKKAAMEKSPLKNQQFQQQLKQGISQIEAISKNTEDLKKKLSDSEAKWRNFSSVIDEALKNYDGAMSLNPEFPEARKNSEAAKDVVKKLDEEAKHTRMLVDELSGKVQRLKEKQLAEMKNKLQKLVRDDNQQNQNQNQNQQNQQNQNQNQDQQQNQQQNQNQQNQNDQQNQQDKNQNQQNQQQDKNRQQEQNKEDRQKQKDQNESQKNKSDNNKKDKDEQAVEQNKQDRDKSQENKQAQNEDKKSAQEMKDSEKEKSEQAVPQEKKEDKAEQAPSAPSQEKAAEKQGEQNENFRAAEGAMTRSEARQLLESMKDEEKSLPLRGYGEQKDRFEKSYKDW